MNKRMKERRKEKGGFVMKGYNLQDGYMGYVEGRYILFASEKEYREYMEEEEALA